MELHKAYKNILLEKNKLETDNRKLQQWVSDLQSGMYINCVYCGHRYGPKDEVPASMADVLKKHIETCPDHPMSNLHGALKMIATVVKYDQKVPRDKDEAALLAACNAMQMIAINTLNRHEVRSEDETKTDVER